MTLGSSQRDAWIVQLKVLKESLAGRTNGSIYLEYVIPRLGRRIDAVVLLHAVVFVIEFKVGEAAFPRHALDQVIDYPLDLKHFHQASHHLRWHPYSSPPKLQPSPC